MNKKTIIGIWGDASQGKSSSVREIVNRVSARFPGATITYLINLKDIKVIVQIGSVKIGIESQGDPPGKRLEESLKEFEKIGCMIIICTTRTRGHTVNLVNEMNTKYGYDIIWTSNYFSKEKPIAYLNETFADHILTIVNDLIKGII